MAVRNFGPSTSIGACSSEIAGAKDTSAESSAEESSPKRRRTEFFGTSDRTLARDAAHMAVVSRMTDLFKAVAEAEKEKAAPPSGNTLLQFRGRLKANQVFLLHFTALTFVSTSFVSTSLRILHCLAFLTPTFTFTAWMLGFGSGFG